MVPGSRRERHYRVLTIAHQLAKEVRVKYILKRVPNLRVVSMSPISGIIWASFMNWSCNTRLALWRPGRSRAEGGLAWIWFWRNTDEGAPILGCCRYEVEKGGNAAIAMVLRSSTIPRNASRKQILQTTCHFALFGDNRAYCSDLRDRFTSVLADEYSQSKLNGSITAEGILESRLRANYEFCAHVK